MAWLSLNALRSVAVLALGGGASLALVLTARDNLAILRRKTLEYQAELAREVAFLRMKVSAREIARAQLCLLLLSLGSLLWGNLVVASFALLPVVCVVPVLGTRRARRISALETQ